MKNIHWLIPYDNPNLEDLKKSNLASIRLRPLVLLNQTDYKVNFGNIIENNSDLILIGKISYCEDDSRENLWTQQILTFKKAGKKIILDYTDNHLRIDSPLYSFYKKIIPFIDAAITPSLFLKTQLEKHTLVPVKVIPDGIEIEIFNPIKKNHMGTNILWFGHNTNIPYLIEFANNLKKLKTTTTIFILTNHQGIKYINKSFLSIHQNLSLQIAEWSIDSMISTSKFCDLVIIPSDTKDIKKRGASSNRLITALALGLPVACDLIDSYKEFSNYFTDIRSENFFTLLDTPNIFHGQVIAAQKNIVPQFSQNIICQKWLNFFDSL